MAETGPNVVEQPELTKRGRFRLEEVAFLALVGLSVIGESVTNYSPITSFWYWLIMIPVFAMIAIITEWSQARARAILARNVILIQIVHWGGTCIALFATYSLWHVGRLGNEHTGIVIMLLLALTTFLDGYHVGWRFYLAGLLLFAYTGRCRTGYCRVAGLKLKTHILIAPGVMNVGFNPSSKALFAHFVG
jgi:hypothetical protein